MNLYDTVCLLANTDRLIEGLRRFPAAARPHVIGEFTVTFALAQQPRFLPEPP